MADSTTTPEGNLCWGVDPDKFDDAVSTFPVLASVLIEFFGSPISPVQDRKFLRRWRRNPEEFDGLLEDLEKALKRYRLAAVLVNGRFGCKLPDTEVRGQLASLQDQLTNRGAFARR